VPVSEVKDMVLFIGDYDAAQGHRPLPMAEEEGKKLVMRYQGIRRTADMTDVTDLVKDEIQEDGQQVVVDAIHFACHGEVSTEPRYNGIVLNDSGVRLGADIISGSSIGLTSNPFVFLNACQLGTETVSLDGSYGGMAGAFLSQGATGFIAPLWSVDDDVAQDFAVQFYKGVYDDHRPVAEVMAELRSRFNAESSKPRSSYLAYVYYGHPELVINKA
jgi:CHAT domain-containing protein